MRERLKVKAVSSYLKRSAGSPEIIGEYIRYEPSPNCTYFQFLLSGVCSMTNSYHVHTYYMAMKVRILLFIL
jgi:hypothetical protein